MCAIDNLFYRSGPQTVIGDNSGSVQRLLADLELRLD
jgi:hypothetical protein